MRHRHGAGALVGEARRALARAGHRPLRTRWRAICWSASPSGTRWSGRDARDAGAGRGALPSGMSRSCPPEKRQPQNRLVHAASQRSTTTLSCVKNSNASRP
jgi:hypothetical protein